MDTSALTVEYHEWVQNKNDSTLEHPANADRRFQSSVSLTFTLANGLTSKPERGLKVVCPRIASDQTLANRVLFVFPSLSYRQSQHIFSQNLPYKVTKLFTSLKADSPDKSPRHCDSEVSFGSDQSQ